MQNLVPRLVILSAVEGQGEVAPGFFQPGVGGVW